MTMNCLYAASPRRGFFSGESRPPVPRRRAAVLVVAGRPPLLSTSTCQQESRNCQSSLSIGVSRRDATTCMAASLLATFLVTKPAEAGRIKPEIRQKIREKLDKMREKAGVPKEKSGFSVPKEKAGSSAGGNSKK